MEKISDVQKQITEVEKQTAANKEAIMTTEARIRDARGRSSEIEKEITSLREQRQTALAKGEDGSELSRKMKEIADESELKNDEITGLNNQLHKLKTEEAKLSSEFLRLKRRVPQLQTLILAQEYNKLAAQLAEVVKELNKTSWQIEHDGNNGAANHVVFALKEGALARIPKLYFDEDGPTLDGFVARHPGIYPSNLSPSDRCFYDWDTHRNDMIHRRS